MSITRAFTTRRVKQSLEAAEEAKVQRRSISNATKRYGGVAAGQGRLKISAPMELIHTTNMLSYNAPDIFPRKVSDNSTSSPSSSASAKSDEDSDAHTNASTPPTSPDVPTMILAGKVESNHLSSYFTAPTEKVDDRLSETPTPTLAKLDAPAIPQRSPSHTKRAADSPVWSRAAPARLSEQSARSVATKASSTFSRESSASTNTSTTFRSSAATSHMPKVSTSSVTPPTVPAMPPSPPQVYQHRKQPSGSRHPFGQELAQVSELAEEFSIAAKAEISAASQAIQEEEQALRSRGLLKFSADDYMSDIRGLASLIFGEIRPVGTVWI